MSDHVRITGRLIAAARALVGVSAADFASAAGISTDTLGRIECAGSAWITEKADLCAAQRALDHYGVILVEEEGGMGAGVRLKFTRSDTRQIARLEGEGGVAGSDDAP